MKTNHSLAGLACLTMSLSALAAPVLADTPVAVVQVGDSALSCEALAAEINGLSQAQTQRAKQASQRRSLMSFATGALQVAGPYLGGMGGGSNASALIGNVASQGAMTAALSSAQSSQPAAAEPTPEAARLERLNGLFTAKSC